MLLDIGSLQNRLSPPQSHLPSTSERLSAVLFPLVYEKDQHSILFTKRSPHLKSHPGQISFPGGTMDPTDPDLLFTALREWEEEMGVSQKVLRLVGKLDEMETRTGFHITSFLVEFDFPLQFSPDTTEVAEVFTLPLYSFWNLPFYVLSTYPIFYFDTPNGLLWGATAEMVVRFLRNYTNFNRIPEKVNPNLEVPPFFKIPTL